MTQPYNYGTCDVCGTLLQEKYIKQNFWLKGDMVIVENVPAGVCPQCGAKVVRAEVGHWLLTLLRNSERIATAPRIAVPLIHLEPIELVPVFQT